MQAKNNWQTYRTALKGKEAIITVNLAIAEQLDENAHSYVIHFSIPLSLGSDRSITTAQQYLDQFSQTLLPLMALGDSLFAGYIVADEKITLYFYSKDADVFTQSLQRLDFIHSDGIVPISQADPNCDLYYDFLLPSPLEMKLNATADTLTLLQQEGEDLSKPRQITHKFQFEREEMMEEFIDYFAQQLSFDIKYTETPVQYDGESVYLVNLEQEASLDDDTIFNLVEEFEQQAAEYDGEYNGWECQMLSSSEKAVH